MTQNQARRAKRGNKRQQASGEAETREKAHRSKEQLMHNTREDRRRAERRYARKK